MIRLTFVRHGATAWNAAARFQGQTDVPLSDLGREQARGVAERLRGTAFDQLRSSDLSRARETAAIVAPDRDVQTDARWREFDFGRWEGLTWDEIAASDPRYAGTEPADVRIYAPPGGETFADVQRRVRQAIAEIAASGAQTPLVVTHAGAIHAALAVLLAEPPRVKLAPASITTVRFEGTQALLERLNA